MKNPKVLSVNAFAKRFGLTRSTVIDRIRAGTLASQYNTRTKLYSIPWAEVTRTRNEIMAGIRVLDEQNIHAQSIAIWIDDQIEKAAKLVQEAEAHLKDQTARTTAYSAAQETLNRAIAIHTRALSLRTPYLFIARDIERAAREFLAQFTDEQRGIANGK